MLNSTAAARSALRSALVHCRSTALPFPCARSVIRSEQTSSDAACVGWDGRPLRGGDEADMPREKDKPTSLSELKAAGTQKPITGATNHAAAGREGEIRFLVVWESADGTLERAQAMWSAAREKGAPDWPHSMALARKLRERDGPWNSYV